MLGVFGGEAFDAGQVEGEQQQAAALKQDPRGLDITDVADIIGLG